MTTTCTVCGVALKEDSDKEHVHSAETGKRIFPWTDARGEKA